MQSCYKGIYKSDGMRGGIGRERDVQRYTYGDQPRENPAVLGNGGISEADCGSWEYFLRPFLDQNATGVQAIRVSWAYICAAVN